MIHQLPGFCTHIAGLMAAGSYSFTPANDEEILGGDFMLDIFMTNRVFQLSRLRSEASPSQPKVLKYSGGSAGLGPGSCLLIMSPRQLSEAQQPVRSQSSTYCRRERGNQTVISCSSGRRSGDWGCTVIVHMYATVISAISLTWPSS